MPWIGAAIMGGTSLLGGLMGSDASSNASSAQQQSASNATGTQLQMYNQTRDDQSPWRQAGSTALNQLGSMTSPGGSMTHTFDAGDLNANMAPNYQFQLGQGLGAVNNQSSVTGGLVGGNALKGINDYAQGAAGSAYQQAYQNYNNNQTNIFNRLSNIAGLGQTSVGATGTVGSNLASNVGSAQLASGAAQAAGIIGGNNALTNSISNMTGSWMGNNLTGGKLFGNGGGTGTSAASNYVGAPLGGSGSSDLSTEYMA